MLLYFRFKNYKSFHEESILDLRASKISDHEEGVSEVFGKRILNIAGIFGANASILNSPLSMMKTAKMRTILYQLLRFYLTKRVAKNHLFLKLNILPNKKKAKATDMVLR
jgi:Ca2+/Na+ antiporter